MSLRLFNKHRMFFCRFVGLSIVRAQALGTKLETFKTCAMKYLQRYWSEVNDGQGDCYDRMVTARSRNHELPAPGYYSAFSNAPLHGRQRRKKATLFMTASPLHMVKVVLVAATALLLKRLQQYMSRRPDPR